MTLVQVKKSEAHQFANRPGWTLKSEWTVDDLDALPDVGVQVELFDGVLVVSPAPIPVHQLAVGGLFVLLRSACPPELQVFVAPLDFRPTHKRSLQPDVLVVRRDRIGPKNVVHPPVLAVEVLSPSTRTKDLVFKRDAYATSGVAHYWTFDPDSREFVAYALSGSEYKQVARATGPESVDVAEPFPVVVCPDRVAEG
jgi:Uma2 family endonuclease